MKQIITLLIVINLYPVYGQTDSEILDKTIAKLDALTTIRYDVRIVAYSEEIAGNNGTRSGKAYFDFTNKDTLGGFRYQFVSDSKEQVFNGKQCFNVDFKDEMVLYKDNPSTYDIYNPILISTSIFEAKVLLPQLIRDNTIVVTRKKDTVINTIDCYKFNFLIPDKFIDINAVLTKLPSPNKKTHLNYQITISKKRYLPIEIKTVSPDNFGSFTATFGNCKTGITKEDSVWSYDRFSDKYAILEKEQYYKSKKNKMTNIIGSGAPDFTLPNIDGDMVSLSSFNSQLTLLEFWFPNCGACVIAVPHINEIQKKYKDKGLKVYGIEYTESSKENLKSYIIKQNIEFPILYEGKDVAKSYDAFAAPTIYLLNKKKEIVYASIGLKKEDLIKVINDRLK
ncbi:TlpA disulfide reductase family protein [uncultured Aquimarina sp.]|uniref:peroxiredoxin family protein n=1 Tax=uncultured Aquimarina sp. TaxID=575652 RepID=UPI00262EAFF2|nr:TlpA disulfide reductase family protein [uncultured Aquimarina sp.]